MFIISFPVYYSQNKTKLISSTIMRASGSVALFHPVSWVFVCLAIILTPNPAYVSVITGLAPIWFMVYYRLKGIKDDASPMAGMFMAVAAIIVLIAAR